MLDTGAAASTAASNASRESITPSVRMNTNINDRTCAQQHEKSRPAVIVIERQKLNLLRCQKGKDCKLNKILYSFSSMTKSSYVCFQGIKTLN